MPIKGGSGSKGLGMNVPKAMAHKISIKMEILTRILVLVKKIYSDL